MAINRRFTMALVSGVIGDSFRDYRFRSGVVGGHAGVLAVTVLRNAVTVVRSHAIQVPTLYVPNTGAGAGAWPAVILLARHRVPPGVWHRRNHRRSTPGSPYHLPI